MLSNTNYKMIFIFAVLNLGLSSCHKAKTFQQATLDELNEVPIEMEIPETPENDENTNEDITDLNSDLVSGSTIVNTNENEQKPQPRPTLRPQPPSPRPIRRPILSNQSNFNPNDVLAPTPEGPSKFIQIAQWVINNEAKKLGTACNFYVSRVLEIAGYSDDSFKANDFDLYARHNFASYDAKSFDSNQEEIERPRMRDYIWSLPERTPFIVNWERSSGRHGHIAIIERIGNQLVIFQASMNRHIPQRRQTTIENIVDYSRQAKITLYSNFRK